MAFGWKFGTQGSHEQNPLHDQKNIFIFFIFIILLNLFFEDFILFFKFHILLFHFYTIKSIFKSGQEDSLICCQNNEKILFKFAQCIENIDQ